MDRFLGIALAIASASVFAAPCGAWAGPGTPAELGQFRNTYYYSAIESSPQYAGLPVDAALFDMSDQVLARVSSKYKHDIDIEGTGRLVDGRVVNFAGRKDGSTRYHVVQTAYGLGVGTCALRPFRTIAVDPTRIPLGSVVQIDETIGMRLPDGTRHDGIWYAEDIGSAIQHDRVDLFVGEGNQGAVLERAGITNLMPLTIRLIAPPPAHSCVDEVPAP